MLNLRILSPKGIKSSLQISSSSSIYDLRSACCGIFDINDVSSIIMLYKFPPEVVALSDDTTLTSNIENNETIRLQLKENSQVQMQGNPSPKSSTSKGKKKVTNQNETETHSFGFGARLASIADGKIVHEKRKIDSSNNDKKKKQKSSDNYWDKLVQKPRVRASRGKSASNEGDISEHLIAAASGEMNTRGKSFRKAFKTAIEYHYQWSLSVQRLGSLYSGHYSIEECENSRVLGSGASTTLKIKFQKSARKYHEEEYQLVPIPLLKSILESALNDEDGNGREFLKPANMARSTKQIFWSIVKHYGPDVPHALKTLFPHIKDWSWLTERTRELSEKAKRNLEQQQQLAEEKSRRANTKKGKDDVSKTDAVDLTNDDMNNTATITTTTNIINSNKMNPELINAFEGCGTLEPIVPEEWIEKVKIVIGANDIQSNHVFLLANYTAEFENKSYLENLVESIRQLDEEKGDKIAPSLEQCDSWMAVSQSYIVKAYWSLVCGGNYRLWYAIRYHLLTVSPIQMKSWIKNPTRFYGALLDADPELKNITMKNPFKSSSINSSSSSSSYFVTEDPPGTLPILHKQSSSSSSSSYFVTGDPVAFLQKPSTSSSSLPQSTSASIPLDNREYVLLNLEWIVWLCNITEQLLTIEWIKFYDGTLDDENDDTEDDDNNENNIDDEGWLYELTDNKYIGKRVRIFIEDNFFQEAKIIAFLPPTEEDEPLWRAELDSFSKTKKNKYEDLDQAELSIALM